MFTPDAIRGERKYGTRGGCTHELLEGLNLPGNVAESIAEQQTFFLVAHCTASFFLITSLTLGRGGMHMAGGGMHRGGGGMHVHPVHPPWVRHWFQSHSVCSWYIRYRTGTGSGPVSAYR